MEILTHNKFHKKIQRELLKKLFENPDIYNKITEEVDPKKPYQYVDPKDVIDQYKDKSK